MSDPDSGLEATLGDASTTDFGVMTLATPNDYLKAIGLALSLRVSNPGVKVAVACSERVGRLVAPYFDIVVLEKQGLRGFVHKVFIDQYSPFEETVFFDSDVLIFKPIRPYLESFRPSPYTAIGNYVGGGFSAFGLDRSAVLRRIGTDRLVQIDGAGHAYFKKPECAEVFDLARKITSEYADWGNGIPYADEDVIDIAMTILSLEPSNAKDFWARPMSARKGTMEMDASSGVCRFVAADSGEACEPCMLHFAANEAPVRYGQQLLRLFKKFGVPPTGLYSQAAGDAFENRVRWPLGTLKRKVLSAVGR